MRGRTLQLRIRQPSLIWSAVKSLALFLIPVPRLHLPSSSHPRVRAIRPVELYNKTSWNDVRRLLPPPHPPPIRRVELLQ